MNRRETIGRELWVHWTRARSFCTASVSPLDPYVGPVTRTSQTGALGGTEGLTSRFITLGCLRIRFLKDRPWSPRAVLGAQRPFTPDAQGVSLRPEMLGCLLR